MFKIEVRDAKQVIVLVAGEVDIVAIEDFCHCGLDAIAQADGRPVVIDAAAVTFIDSTGLNALVTLHKAAAAAGTVLTLRGIPKRMASLLHITGLDTVIPVSDSTDP